MDLRSNQGLLTVIALEVVDFAAADEFSEEQEGDDLFVPVVVVQLPRLSVDHDGGSGYRQTSVTSRATPSYPPPVTICVSEGVRLLTKSKCTCPARMTRISGSLLM